MNITETDSFIIIEDATVDFCKYLELLPFQLVWYEVTVGDGIFNAVAVPENKDQIKHFDVNEIVKVDEVEEDDDITITFKLYFVKGG